MAASSLSVNDTAVAGIRAACQQLADQLDFHFVTTSTQPEGFQPTQFTNYLVPTLPEAVGVFGTSKVQLICVVHMSAPRFWQVLREKLDLPDEQPMPNAENGVYEYLPKEYGWRSDVLSSLVLVLRYCRVPDQDDVFPWHPSNALRDDVTNWNALEDIEDAHIARTWLANSESGCEPIYRDLIVCLINWAIHNGLVAPSTQFGLLTVDCFIWMVHNFVGDRSSGHKDTKDAITAICIPALFDARNERLDIRATGSGRNVAAHVSADGLERFKRAVDTAVGSRAALSDFAPMAEAKQSFCEEHDVSIIVTCECWSVRKQQHYSNLLIDASTSFQRTLRNLSRNKFGANIWPSVKKVDKTTSEICLGVYGLEGQHEIGLPSSMTALPFISGDLDIIDSVAMDCNWNHDEALLSARILTTSELQQPEASNPHMPAMCHLENTETIEPPTARLSSSKPTAEPERTKFLDAAKAISKLRWDPQWSSFEWEIGYEDRFDGLMWKDLKEWQAHTEEEDFIPTHRVRQIRLREGQVIFWNRDTRESSL